jgi:hypothetical protein
MRLAARDGTAPVIPKQIKMFAIDLNYVAKDGYETFAPPGHWASASPQEHVQWYADLGANVINAFTVSCNGYAWYKGGFVPPQPGLKYDFFPDVIRLARKKNMLVAGYYCIAANSKWGLDHPDLSYGTPPHPHIPLTDQYLDYFAHCFADGMKKTGMEICTLDWLWNPTRALRKNGWLESDKKLFTQMTGIRFPSTGVPSDEDVLAYERLAIERFWRRIRETRDQTNRNCLLGLWVYDAKQPSIAGSRLFQELDWFINENPDAALVDFIRQRVRPQTRVIQNECGWPEHNARAFFANPRHRTVDLAGFAGTLSPAPQDSGVPRPIAYYLSKPLDAFKRTDRISISDSNIAALARCYHGLSMDAVIPRKS